MKFSSKFGLGWLSNIGVASNKRRFCGPSKLLILQKFCKNATICISPNKVPKLYSVTLKIKNFIPEIKNVRIPLSRNIS